MSTIVVRCSLHPQLSPEAFHGWLARRSDIAVCRLRDEEWVIALDGGPGAALDDLVGDLTLLGTSPTVHLAGYTFDPMAERASGRDREAMSLSHLPRLMSVDSGRDPAHVLYDHACDVLVAAQGLRAAAGIDGAEPAIAATFGCLESAVDALAEALETLTPTVVAHVGEESAAARRVSLQCQDATHVLRVGRDVLGAIRDRVAAAAPVDAAG